MKFVNFGGAELPEFACKGGYSTQVSDLAVSAEFQTERERTRAVDLAIDGPRPSSPSRQAESRERGSGQGSTCRRGGAAARVGVDCGWPGLRLGGVVLVGELPNDGEVEDVRDGHATAS